MKRFLRSKLVLALTAVLMIAAAIALPLSSNIIHSYAASSTAKLLLRMPWVNGEFQISGNSYSCGDHIDNPGTIYRDAFAIDFGFPSGTKVAAVANGIAHVAAFDATGYGN